MNTHTDIMHDALLDLRDSLRTLGTLTQIDIKVDDHLYRMMKEIGNVVSELDEIYSYEFLDVEKLSK